MSCCSQIFGLYSPINILTTNVATKFRVLLITCTVSDANIPNDPICWWQHRWALTCRSVHWSSDGVILYWCDDAAQTQYRSHRKNENPFIDRPLLQADFFLPMYREPVTCLLHGMHRTKLPSNRISKIPRRFRIKLNALPAFPLDKAGIGLLYEHKSIHSTHEDQNIEIFVLSNN